MLRDEQASTIVDRIYEAAFAPELWSDALEAASAISSSASGAIFMFSDHSPVRAITEAHVQPLSIRNDRPNNPETEPCGFLSSPG
jgi:hypothetical protein